MENSDKIINKKKYEYTKATYNPELDHLEGKILFKKKYEQVLDTISKTVFPQEVIDLMIRRDNK
jgi:hypothetical protein